MPILLTPILFAALDSLRLQTKKKKVQLNNTHTVKERGHIERVKALACSVCDLNSGSEAHHIKQGDAYTCVALCADCHRGSANGWHGRKALWRLKKMDELDALSVTIRRLGL